ncbi:uncharacterized protein LOC115774662 [Archocentrus centrarchus]|uniref:uncharacterized protein LOC115774662 n=1 Tax=Archocentrus centrarchus TaxID=63155 RepID=UPI0011EA3789|nr:uncharacterized protein LOC115774662 [Archocentrus centrarchus]
MAERRWIQISCLMLMIPSADLCYIAPTPEKYILNRAGEDVTLPFPNMENIPENCSGVEWMIFGREVVTITPGATGEIGQKYSDRLSMTANCSLVIKQVTAEDAGYYDCKQYKSGKQGHIDLVHRTVFDLSVVNITELKRADGVKLICSVVSLGMCHYSVMWEWNHTVTPAFMLRIGRCFASVNFLASAFSSRDHSVTCKANNTNTGEEHRFTFSPHLSDDTKIETTRSTSTAEGPTESVSASTAAAEASGDKTGETKSTTHNPTGYTETSTASARSNPLTDVDLRGSGRLTVVCVVCAALLITVVTVVIWIRTKGNTHQMNYVIHHDENEDDAVNYENPRGLFSIRLS